MARPLWPFTQPSDGFGLRHGFQPLHVATLLRAVAIALLLLAGCSATSQSTTTEVPTPGYLHIASFNATATCDSPVVYNLEIVNSGPGNVTVHSYVRIQRRDGGPQRDEPLQWAPLRQGENRTMTRQLEAFACDGTQTYTAFVSVFAGDATLPDDTLVKPL